MQPPRFATCKARGFLTPETAVYFYQQTLLKLCVYNLSLSLNIVDNYPYLLLIRTFVCGKNPV